MKKILYILCMILLLSSCFGNKEKQQKFVEETPSISKVKEVSKKEEDLTISKYDKDIKKISLMELNNSMYSNGWDNLKEKIKKLSKTGSSFENKTKAIYLESFIWDYESALKNKKELCKWKKDDENCKKADISLTSYRPKDLEWNYVTGATLSVNWVEKWKFNLKNTLNLENKFVHRVIVSKEWYLDFYKKIYVDSSMWNSESINPEMVKAEKALVIDSTQDNQVKTTNFVYNIAKDSFTYKNGKDYTGKVKIYAFDIWDDTRDINVFQLDAFSENFDYDGYSFVTFGMPFMRAYDMNGKKLYLKKDIIWTGKVQNIEKSPGIDFKNVPKNVYLSGKELRKYNIPPFWNLNFDSWVWYEAKMKILDEEGNYEFQYTTF